MLDELLEILFVSWQRNVLDVGRYTGIVCTKEDGLALLAVVAARTLAGVARSYHEPDIGGLRRREQLLKNLDSMGGGISSVRILVIQRFFALVIGSCLCPPKSSVNHIQPATIG